MKCRNQADLLTTCIAIVTRRTRATFVTLETKEHIADNQLPGISQSNVDIYHHGNEGNIVGNHLPGTSQNIVDIHHLGNEEHSPGNNLLGNDQSTHYIRLLGNFVCNVETFRLWNDRNSDIWRMSRSVHISLRSYTIQDPPYIYCNLIK